MSETTKHVSSRREFLENTGRIAAATTIAGLAVPHVHAAEDNTLQVALIGCGGRGTGAAADALSVKQGPTKLVAAADVFENRVRGSVDSLKKQFPDQVDVPQDRQFVGFDGYQKAMDCLKPGDIAIFASPLAFRWVHFAYAIQKGLHVFMEKPVTADGPTSRRMLKQAEEAKAKNLKVGVGLMSRHSRALQQLQPAHPGRRNRRHHRHARLPDGGAGRVGVLGKMARAAERIAVADSTFPQLHLGERRMLQRLQHPHHRSLCWMKNAWPVKAQAVGGRHYRGTCVDQNFDSYAVEYTFADGAKLFMDGRNIAGCTDIYSSYVHGSKGMAIASKGGDCGTPSSMHKGQNPDRASHDLGIPESAGDQGNPYDNEWNDLVDAIRDDKPYNEAERGVEASLVSSLGRKAAHTGREITLEDDAQLRPRIRRRTWTSGRWIRRRR